MSTQATRRLPEELLASSLFLLKRMGHAAKVKSLDAYERAGLGPYHHAVLLVLDRGDSDTQGAIADSLGYDRGTLVGLLDDLEERGLVERRRDPGDRRRHLVGLTPEGRTELDRLRAVARQVEDDFLAGLDDAQRAELHDLLLRLAERHEPLCAQPPPR